MSVTLVSTVGAANANSYLTVAEAQAYWDTRLFTDMWEDSDDQAAALMWATRTIDALLSPLRLLITPASYDYGQPYYRIRSTWTGLPASSTQALAWPRTGMYNRNGFAIAEDAIPRELKEAVAELAGQLSLADRTVDNSATIQGATSIKVGPVALGFKESSMTSLSTKVLPDASLFLLVPSWLTDEQIELTGNSAQLDVVSD